MAKKVRSNFSAEVAKPLLVRTDLIIQTGFNLA